MAITVMLFLYPLRSPPVAPHRALATALPGCRHPLSRRTLVPGVVEDRVSILQRPDRYQRKMLLDSVGRVFRSNLLTRPALPAARHLEGPDVRFGLTAAAIAVMLSL